jgi:hypothetical protein
VARDDPHVSVGGLLAQSFFGRKLYFGRIPILGGKSILGASLFLERNIYILSMQHRWKKSSMKKKKEKKHAEK